MNSNVILQVFTVVLALLLAAVLIFVFVMPHDEPYVRPDVNAGMIEVDEFDLFDDETGSRTAGKMFVMNDGEYRIRLVADITVCEGDRGGFRASFFDGMVVDSIICDFNGDIQQAEYGDYVSFSYVSYYDDRGLSSISVDSSAPGYQTHRQEPGSGTLVADLVLDPEKDIRDIEQIEVYVGIGYKGQYMFPIYQHFYLPTEDANKEVEGKSFHLDPVQTDVKIPGAAEGASGLYVADPLMECTISPVFTSNPDGTYTFSPNITIPSGQGKLRELSLIYYTMNADVVSKTTTDLRKTDSKAYIGSTKTTTEYGLMKGSPLESAEIDFDDALTFRMFDGYDKSEIAISILMKTADNGYVNTCYRMISFYVSESGIFFDYQNCNLNERMQEDPTEADIVWFRDLVLSGDVIGIRGDYTKISGFVDIGMDYDPGYKVTAVICDKGTGTIYSEGFDEYINRYSKPLDDWIVSLYS